MSKPTYVTRPYDESVYPVGTTREEAEMLIVEHGNIYEAFPHLLDLAVEQANEFIVDGVFYVLRGTPFDSPVTAILAKEMLDRNEELSTLETNLLIDFYKAFTDDEEHLRLSIMDSDDKHRNLNLFKDGGGEFCGLDLSQAHSYKGNSVLGNVNHSEETVKNAIQCNKSMYYNSLLHNPLFELTWTLDNDNVPLIILPDGSSAALSHKVLASPCVDSNLINAFVRREEYLLEYMLETNWCLSSDLIFSSIKTHLDDNNLKTVNRDLYGITSQLARLDDPVDAGVIVLSLMENGFRFKPESTKLREIVEKIAAGTEFEGIGTVANRFLPITLENLVEQYGDGSTFYDVVCKLSKGE